MSEEERNAVFGEVGTIMQELTETGELLGGEALADPSQTFDASVEYERVLLQVDFIHGDFIPRISRVPAYSRDVA